MLADFAQLSQEQLIQLLIVVGLAAIPAIVWSIALFQGRNTARLPLLLAFFLGTLTVLPLMGLENVWIWKPEWDIYRIIEDRATDAYVLAFATLIVVGILEEFSKSLVVRFINKTKIGIQTINDAVRYSILAGLGFAFTENIFYFFYIWQSSGFVGLLFPMIFRSIFTVCAHMVFSGIFGYYYGLSKFAMPIMEAKLWMRERSRFVQVFSKLLGVNEASSFRQVTLMKGLIISMAIHAAFNLFLEFEYFVPTVLLVGAGFVYLLYLLAHKAGNIVFSGRNRASTMQKRDEDVVLELLGMWTREGRYKDVVDICQRLLMRDPDNKVVQLFQARAMDKAKLAKLENSVGSLFITKDDHLGDRSIRTLVKQRVLMEMLREKQSPAQSPSPAQSGPSSQPSSPSIPQVPSPNAGPQTGA
jgi:RsiW-degrading membrane proteinase PrsW (M82 family)